MERKKPVNGEFYKHFKGAVYQIKTLALDSETQQEKVVYQAMYEPYTCWIRDLDEFMSPVDKEKYPKAGQKYRFEKIDFQNDAVWTDGKQEKASGGSLQKQSGKNEEKASDDSRQKQSGKNEEKASGDSLRKQTDKEIANRGLMQLLDAETFHEKKEIFLGLKQYMDSHMLNNIAVALDIALEEGDVETQFESVMRCMEAFERYEGGRLR